MNIKLVAGLTALALIAAACGGSDDASDETTSTEATEVAPTTDASTTTSTTTTIPATTSTVAPVEEPLRQPLTGVPVETEEELLTRPALAIKIDNNEERARRNHTGIALADFVFEEIVENQDTRFAAIFHTNDADPVGPIRSGRSQDVDLLTSFDQPLFAWSGGNPGVTQLIANSTLVDLNASGSGQGYFRGAGSSPHNLYNTTPALWAQTPPDHPGAPPQQLEYVLPGDDLEGWEPAGGLDLVMRSNIVGWDWNAEEGRFLRSQAGSPHMDVANGQIGAMNVIVMIVPYRPSQIDQASPEAQTIGSGQAVVFSNGQSRRAQWSRDDNTQPISFLDGNGDPILFTPGNTWIELAENNGNTDPDLISTQLTIR